MGNPDTQELVIRLGALEHALALSLRRLVEISGPEAKAEIEALRDRAIMNVKELQHLPREGTGARGNSFVRRSKSSRRHSNMR